MAGPSTTAESILLATRQAIAERGTGQLTMSAVASKAAISRPTLYRWFPTKRDLLAALADYEERRFDTGLRDVIAAVPTPRNQLDAALRYTVGFLGETALPTPIDLDPAFFLESLAASLGPHIDMLAELLSEALSEIPAVREGALTGRQVAELFLRVAYSLYLVPHPDAEALLATMRDLAGLGLSV